jgi:hypothetical protein
MKLHQPRRALGISLALLFASGLIPAQTAVAATGPFVGWVGSWSGNGEVVLESGKENIRCRAQHIVQNDSNNLQQALRCASSSYKFEVNTYIDHNQGAITGYWSELIQDVNGRVTGRTNGNGVDAVLNGVGFGASFKLIHSGNQLQVVITPTPDTDTDVERVSISLRKR